MDIDTVIQEASTTLAPWAKSTDKRADNRLDVGLAADDLLPAVKALREKHCCYLAAITGLDLGVNVGDLEVLYHFCAGPVVVTLRVRTPRAAASVPTVCGLIPSASLYERELIEMFGVTVVGTPDPSRLFLPDEWPVDVYPLRKDFVPEASKA